MVEKMYTTGVMQRLSDLVRTNQPKQGYKPPIVGRLNFRNVANVSVELLRTEETYMHNHSGSPCPCN